jgi:hypothetical protein
VESILILEVFFCIEMHARPYENKLAIPSHPTSNMHIPETYIDTFLEE